MVKRKNRIFLYLPATSSPDIKKVILEVSGIEGDFVVTQGCPFKMYLLFLTDTIRFDLGQGLVP